jgi:enoyl-CoA hydratase
LSDEEVLIDRRGRLGILTLNRPKALNALTLGMVEVIDDVLKRWAGDDGIEAVLFLGAGDKAFCAGGDVRAMTLVEPAEALRLKRAFFAGEYRVDHRIHTYTKPIIALFGGITMGGGAGIAMHARHRVTTERSLFAMPETALGLFPDVGATWFLNRLPGRIGLSLGLAGTRLKASDLNALGLATAHVAAESVQGLVEALAVARALDNPEIEAILASHAADPGEPVVAPRQARIDELYAGGSVTAILRALEAAPEPWAEEAAKTIRGASPTSLATAFRQITTGADLDIAAVFRLEYRISQRIATGPDFPEGVRAILVDRDNAPRWSPARLEDVDAAMLDRIFAPFDGPQDELNLD